MAAEDADEDNAKDDGALPDSLLWTPPGAPGLIAPGPLQADPGKPNIYDPYAPQPPARSLPPGTHGPVAPNLKIEEKVLEGAAGKADEIYDVFYKAAASLEPDTVAAANAVGDLETGAALKSSGKHWEQQAGLVSAWIANISESLRLAARDYQGNETALEDSIRRGAGLTADPGLPQGPTVGRNPVYDRWGF
ncbi:MULTISPECIES: hypothetical protein [unclassified Streptomyces]|jgi:hypothetical protein|uniref:hypothetical protein n=1 Tax=unclassified Streptomyces TaxID=2593676 RepID=UPI00367FF2F4